jgi:hypothetical protein
MLAACGVILAGTALVILGQRSALRPGADRE